MKPPSSPPAPTSRLRRSLRIAGGFGLVLAGIPLLVLPGPGMPAIFFGLRLLAVDFPWAARLYDRLLSGTDELQRRLVSRSMGLTRGARHMASDLTRRIGRRRPKTPQSGDRGTGTHGASGSATGPAGQPEVHAVGREGATEPAAKPPLEPLG